MPRLYRPGFFTHSLEMLDTGGGESASKGRRSKPEGPFPGEFGRPVDTAAGSRDMQTPIFQTVGGLLRPWMTYGAAVQSRTLVEDAGVVLWEGGEKTTPEIKREILDLLDQHDSLVAVVDLKAAERPDVPRWWPSLTTVLTWVDEDPFFAKAIEQWKHARQERILERVIWDLNGPDASKITKAEFALLKERVKFASAVLPRIVNKGLREKVDIESKQSHLHLHTNLSDEALEEKLRALRRNPMVRDLLVLPDVDGVVAPGAVGGETVEGQVLPPSPEAPAALPFRDPDELGADLLGGEP